MKEYIDREEFLKRLNVLYNVLDNLEKMLYSSPLIELVDIPKERRLTRLLRKYKSCEDVQTE